MEKPIVFYNQGQQLNGILHSPVCDNALCPAVVFFPRIHWNKGRTAQDICENSARTCRGWVLRAALRFSRLWG